jgi:hypothetical protein
MENKEQLKQERDNIIKGLEESYKRLVEYKKRINSPTHKKMMLFGKEQVRNCKFRTA